MIDAIAAGMRPDPSFDCTPIFDSIGAGWLHFPIGAWYFRTPPQRITRKLKITGEGTNGTTLVRAYDGSKLDDALLHATATLDVSGLALWAGGGTRGGGAIRLDGLQASGSVLRDLYITTGGGTWDIPLVLVSGAPLGIRSVHCDNLELFAATVHILWGINLRGCTFQSVNGYPAGGTKDDFVFQGAGEAGYCENVILTTRYLQNLWLYDTHNLTFMGVGATVVHQNPGCRNVRLG